jgi:DNA (cytosine-5)-methyltransferase 1
VGAWTINFGRKLKLLDLFCGAGGAGYGYYLAGFEVFGVDIKFFKRNPHPMIVMDWKEALWKYYKDFDLIHASPPCQAYSFAALPHRMKGKEYPDLIGEVREELIKTGKDYVIENVPGSPLINPIVLNGSVFGLLVHRKRLFECNFPAKQPIIPLSKAPLKMGRSPKEGDVIQPVGNFIGRDYARKQMEIDWMTTRELAQAIPPSYTKYIGEQYVKDYRCS